MIKMMEVNDMTQKNGLLQKTANQTHREPK